MNDHHKAILEERLNYYLRKRIIYAELDTGGKIIQCPKCHVPFKPHLGNWIADKFPCVSCKANLSFRNSTAKTARCPCCNISRPVPNNLIILVCAGCQAKVIHQKRDKAVKCSDCKHINIPTVGRTYGVRPANQDPPQVNQDPPQVNQDPPQVNQDPPQVNRVVPPQVNQVVPPQVNQAVPPQVSQGVPPQVNQDPPQSYWVVPVQVNKDQPQVNRVVPPQVNQAVPPQVSQGVPPQVNQDPPQSYWVVPVQVNKDQPQVYRLGPRQLNQAPPKVKWVFPPQVNQDPPQVNQDPPQVYQIVPQQVKRVVPPRVYHRRNRVATAETESTASSSFTPRNEIIVVEYPDDSVAEAVRNVATKRVVEEDKTEASGSKKIRL